MDTAPLLTAKNDATEHDEIPTEEEALENASVRDQLCFLEDNQARLVEEAKRHRAQIIFNYRVNVLLRRKWKWVLTGEHLVNILFGLALVFPMICIVIWTETRCTLETCPVFGHVTVAAFNVLGMLSVFCGLLLMYLQGIFRDQAARLIREADAQRGGV